MRIVLSYQSFTNVVFLWTHFSFFEGKRGSMFVEHSYNKGKKVHVKSALNQIPSLKTFSVMEQTIYDCS